MRSSRWTRSPIPTSRGRSPSRGSRSRRPKQNPSPQRPDELGSEPPNPRQLQERIARLDETLARIAAMLPLLRGGDDREQEP